VLEVKTVAFVTRHIRTYERPTLALEVRLDAQAAYATMDPLDAGSGGAGTTR
jgi:hypothetical protein